MNENLHEDDSYTGLEDYDGTRPPMEPYTCMLALRGIPIHFVHNPDLVEWENVRPGIGGISEETSLLIYEDGRTSVVGDEDKFLATLLKIAETKKLVLFKNCQELFATTRELGECEFYPKNEDKLTRAEKRDFIDKLLSEQGRMWLDIEAYANLICRHAQIPYYQKEITEFNKGYTHNVIAFSGTGKKLGRRAVTEFYKQVETVQSWVNSSCYDVGVPSLNGDWEYTNCILPTGAEFRLRGGKNPWLVAAEADVNYLIKNKKGPLRVYLPYATTAGNGEEVEFSSQKHVIICAETKEQVEDLQEFYQKLGYERTIRVKTQTQKQR